VQVWSQTTAFEKEIYRELSIEHAEEVSRGFRTFGRSKSEPNKWMGEDFNVIELPPNSAGPTETTLKRGSGTENLLNASPKRAYNNSL
jgi:hypothetical protein